MHTPDYLPCTLVWVDMTVGMAIHCDDIFIREAWSPWLHTLEQSEYEDLPMVMIVLP